MTPRRIQRPMDTSLLEVGERYTTRTPRTFLVQSENPNRNTVTLFSTCPQCGVGYSVEAPRAEEVETPPYGCYDCFLEQWVRFGYADQVPA